MSFMDLVITEDFTLDAIWRNGSDLTKSIAQCKVTRRLLVTIVFALPYQIVCQNSHLEHMSETSSDILSETLTVADSKNHRSDGFRSIDLQRLPSKIVQIGWLKHSERSFLKHTYVAQHLIP